MRLTARHLRIGIPLVVLVLILGLSVRTYYMPSQRQAIKQINGFNEAINANKPANIYPYLIPELRGMISKETFEQNFAKERSYPYLSPLYVYLDEVLLVPDQRSGEAISTVAARLPGQKMKVKLIYIKGQYYIDAFRDIADGSYLLKFEKLGQ